MRLDLIDIPPITRIDGGEFRKYQTPDGVRLPSVTSVLSLYEGEDPFAKWRAAVGAEEAAKISTRAANRGTKVHLALENYILENELPKFDHFHQEESRMFRDMKPIVDDIKIAYGIELQMWSTTLGVAGTADFIGVDADGKLKIFDWKTASRLKDESQIQNYFLQGAAYSMMLWERTGKIASVMKICIATPDDGVQVFEQPVKPYVPLFVQRRKLFEQKYGI